MKTVVLTALIPVCPKDVMTDLAVAHLKVKRRLGYGDVVRDYRKRTGMLTNLSYQFDGDCGKAIEAIIARSAVKS